MKISEETLSRHDLSSFPKSAKYVSAKRYPSRFAFAKRHELEDMNNYDTRAMRFVFGKRFMRNFAFAKRDPYSSFA
ncbi:unnamed protein product [Thelazia callipaeda]|uniref:Uncharacterized protein n=1 Tax=Thelazia callipaeda TaxID=103827 RepID=A0A0N5CVV8_THECL|nr:unnamed protein product [Thelazia callipaeda]